jgi:excisionase family DNA binding protein
MSKRPWPENAWPTGEQLLEWCRTSLTSEVVPYLDRLIESHIAITDPARFITVDEAAKRLSVSRMMIYRWIKSGRLQAAKFGPGTLRIRLVDVETLIREATT